MGDAALIAPDNTIDFLKVKVFLYKYTPEMIPAGDSYHFVNSDQLKAAKSNQDALDARLKYTIDVYNKLSDILKIINGEIPFIRTEYKNPTPRRAILIKPLTTLLEIPTIGKNDLLYRDKLSEGPSTQETFNLNNAALRNYNQTHARTITHLTEASLHGNVTQVLFKLKANNIWDDRDIDYVAVTLEAVSAAISSALKWLKAYQGKIAKDQGFVSVEAAQAEVLAQKTKQFKINRFTYDLSPKFLSRFDISRFIHSYNSSQSLDAGTINWDINLSNDIVPFAWLESDGYLEDSVRRPIFFPDAKGNYDLAEGNTSDAVYKNFDPLSLEFVSTISSGELTRYIATYQSLEDINRKKKGQSSSGEFYDDVDRIEFAMRMRGIRDEQKKKDIITFFETGVLSDSLQKMLPPGTFLTIDSTRSFTQQKLQLLSYVTDDSEDGLQLGDLVSRYDFISVFVYKWRVPPRDVEEILLKKDINFFDKEAMFQYTPYNYLLAPGQIDNSNASEYFPLYDPEFNGFIKTKTYTEAACRVNALSLKGEGVLSLFSASRRIYNTTIWQGSIFEAAEAIGADTFSIFQNLFQDKNPMGILEILLEGVYKLKLRGQSKLTSTTDYAKKYLPQTLESDQSYRNGRDVYDFLIALREKLKVFGEETVPQFQRDEVNSMINKLFTLSGLKQDEGISEFTSFEEQGVFAYTKVRLTQGTHWELLLLKFPEVEKQPDITYKMSKETREDIYKFKSFLQPSYGKPLQFASQSKLDVLSKWLEGAIKRSEKYLTDYQNQTRSEKEIQAASAAGEQSRTVDALLAGPLFKDSDGQPTSIFDIAEMRLLNRYGEVDSKTGQPKGSRLLFNIPMFLYANVMRMRRFNTRVPQRVSASASNYQNFNINHTTDIHLPKQAEGAGGSVLELNPYLTTDIFKPYFLFLSGSLGNYIPDMKTPFEIINDVKASSYLELFETPGGRIVFRTPQWNNTIHLQLDALSSPTLRNDLKADTPFQINVANSQVDSTNMKSRTQANMFTSYDIDIISTTYEESAQGFISKQHLGFGVDLIGLPIEQLFYHYTNGKILSQYGLMTDKIQLNPNVRAIPLKKKAADQSYIDEIILAEGIFEYCRFFLEMHNMARSVGVIRAAADPLIRVGHTFYDARNQKFGYINNVVKSLVVGGTYSCTFNMVAVRDTAPSSLTSQPEIRKLPYLGDIIKKFKANTPADIDDKPRPLISKPAKKEAAERLLIKDIEKESVSFPRSSPERGDQPQ